MEEKERYGITDAHYICDSAIFDTETDEILRLYQICDLLNQQDKRIKELEEYIKSKENCNEWLTMADNDNLQKENQQLKQQLALTEKALELAVADKCKFENALLSTSLGITNGKVAVPKKEQWYLEQAEKESERDGV